MPDKDHSVAKRYDAGPGHKKDTTAKNNYLITDPGLLEQSLRKFLVDYTGVPEERRQVLIRNMLELVAVAEERPVGKTSHPLDSAAGSAGISKTAESEDEAARGNRPVKPVVTRVNREF